MALRLPTTPSPALMNRLFATPRSLALSMSAYPPLFAAGVRVRNVAEDWSSGDIGLTLNALNRNMHGAAFGGTLFAMTDALFGTLVMKRLGRGFEAWTRTGTFQYLNPGRSGAVAHVEVTDAMVAQIREEIEADGFCNIPYTTVIENRDGSVAGIGQQELHCRPSRGREARRSRREQAAGGSRPRVAEPGMEQREPRGITLASLATAVAWRALHDDPSALATLLSEVRRIPAPEDQARRVAEEALGTGALTREQVLETGIPERLLPAAG